MRSLFLKLYFWLMLATCFVILAAWQAFEIISDYRYNQYLLDSSRPIAKILQQGANRHEGEDQQKWVSIVSGILGLELTLHLASDTVEPGPYVLPLENSRNLTLNWQPYSEKLAIGVVQLFISEIGRLKTIQRKEFDMEKTLQDFMQQYQLHMEVKHYQDIGLSTNHLKQLNSIGYWVDDTFDITVYSRLGSSEEVLILYSLPTFQKYSPYIIIPLILISVTCVLFFLLLQLRPLERRLARLAKKVDEFGSESLEVDIAEPGVDGLAKLSQQTHDMAIRIRSLLLQQKEFTRAVSHEFRTPLAKMQLRLQIMLKHDADNERIQLLMKNVAELTEMVDELLTYSNLENDNSRFVFEQQNIVDLVRDYLEGLEELKPNVALVLNECDANLEAEVDQYYLKRAVVNIITNGQRYAQSRIEVTLSADDEHLQLAFENDGPPLDEAFLESIFQPFKVVDESRNKKTGGYGLGLSIVQRICHWHGGEILAANGRLGGAKFTITLPKSQNSKKR